MKQHFILVPFLSIQLFLSSRKLDNPVATTTSEFSISMAWHDTDSKFLQIIQENTDTYYFKCSWHIFKVLSDLVSPYLKHHFTQDNCHYSCASKLYNFLHRCKICLQVEKFHSKTTKYGSLLLSLPAMPVP